MAKLIVIFFLLNYSFLIAQNDKVISNVSDFTSSNEVEKSFSMIDTLKDLHLKANPLDYYHLNQKLAVHYSSILDNIPQEEQLTYWYLYCEQLLKAGENQMCIDEIEATLKSNKINYNDLINDKFLPIIELLAIAYLRLGEVTNCQDNHNEYSCILPLNELAFHKNKKGSTKAIEIYRMIDDQFPNDTYKWLLNIAHMTLGQYSTKFSKKIMFPDWKSEIKDFPKFKERGGFLGIADDKISGGVSVEDFNNDGLVDIFTTSYGMSDQCELFINTGNGFVNRTIEAGLEGIVSGLNCVHADYDNDGDIDIFILRGAWLGEAGNHPNSLLRNNGDGSFTDVTYASGTLSFYPTQTAAWADVNKDGYLDLFIGNESQNNLSNPCELYINQKNGTFIEQSEQYNLGSLNGFIKGVTFGDINNDSWPDLYVSIMGGKNLLFKNNKGRFEDISSFARVQDPYFSFTTWFWDVNNDGYDDIFVADYDNKNTTNLVVKFVSELKGLAVLSDKSKLYMNNKNNRFTESSEIYKVNKSFYAMGSNFGDLDNDGFLDFYIGTGSPEFQSVVPNRMFRNVNGNSFEEVTSAGGFGHIQKGHGVGFADFDKDGDQDIYAVLGGAFEGDNYPNVYFENPISQNNWIVLKLEGVNSNKSAIGTKLKFEFKNGKTIFSSINTGGSFGNNSLQAEVGIGKNKYIKKLTVFWPNSNAQTFINIQPNKKYHLVEGTSNLQEIPYKKLSFDGIESPHHHRH